MPDGDSRSPEETCEIKALKTMNTCSDASDDDEDNHGNDHSDYYGDHMEVGSSFQGLSHDDT